MSVQRSTDRLTIICDDCQDYMEDEDEAGFYRFWEDLKADGWRAKKKGQDWLHYCPECVAVFVTK